MVAYVVWKKWPGSTDLDMLVILVAGWLFVVLGGMAGNMWRDAREMTPQRGALEKQEYGEDSVCKQLFDVAHVIISFYFGENKKAFK
jgi:hypothetical protein